MAPYMGACSLYSGGYSQYKDITIDDFRGVVDENQVLQAIAAIKEVEVEYEEERLNAIAIESLTNAPWNFIEQIQVETKKINICYYGYSHAWDVLNASVKSLVISSWAPSGI